MALFYWKLYAKHLLPSSIIQDINEQFNEINIEVAVIFSSKLQGKLNLLSIEQEIINDILQYFCNKSVIKELNHSFDTHYKRMA